MSECRWTYYDPAQGNQTLGIYHGEKSGHVVIYHNEKVVIVDFMVHSSKSYSFMFNQNLLKLELKKSDSKFRYFFQRTWVEDTVPNPTVMSKFINFIRRPFAAAS